MKFKNTIGEYRFTPRKLIRRSTRVIKSIFYYLLLSGISQYSRKSFISPDNEIAINLTSYGPRIKHVHLTLESIALGSMLPNRIILWLDPEDYDRVSEDKGVQRAIKRGLEVKRGDQRYRAHNKYYNFVASNEPGILLTADDDIFYPRHWLQDLWTTFSKVGGLEVVAHAARRPHFIDDTLAPYNYWRLVSDTRGEFGNFSLGVSGVLFPDKLTDVLLSAGEDFLKICPLADDVWINRHALVAGLAVRQCNASPLRALVVPMTQMSSLAVENVLNGRNDSQIQSTYTSEDICQLKDLLKGSR